jgi:hypothetical protein
LTIVPLPLGVVMRSPSRLSSLLLTILKNDFLPNYQNILYKQNTWLLQEVAVGCKMAGEIATCYNDSKHVSWDALLLGDIKDELRAATLAQLQKLGVDVILEERLVDGPDANKSPKDGHDAANNPVANQTFLSGMHKLKTNKGTELEADLVFLCWGAAVNSASLQAHFGSKVINKGG